MFVVKHTDSFPKTNQSKGDLSKTDALMLGLKYQTKLHEVRIVSGCKNDTNTPVAL